MTERIRPLPGNLWCEKYTPGLNKKLKLNGMVWEGSMTSSGLFLPSAKSEPVNDVLAKLYRVESVGGESPEGWTTKWFLPSKETTSPRTRNWNTTFAEQGVEEGVVVAASAKAGARNELMAEYVQLRHDELVAIGKPLDAAYDEDEFAMFAAPGWVIVALDGEGAKHKSGLIIDERVNTREVQGSAQWGRIVELPRGVSYDDLGNIAVGLRVSFPYALHAGDYALEWVDFEGGYRALPLMCLLAVAYEPDDGNAGIRGFDDATWQMDPKRGDRRIQYMNPYEPGSIEFEVYDMNFTEALCK